MTKRPLGLPPCSAAAEPAGFPDISRGLSAAIPPENRPPIGRTQEGCQGVPPPHASGTQSAIQGVRRRHGGIPPGCGNVFRRHSGGRRCAGPPANVCDRSAVGSEKRERNEQGATHNLSCAVLGSPQYFVRFPQHPEPVPRASLCGCRRDALPWADLFRPLWGGRVVDHAGLRREAFPSPKRGIETGSPQLVLTCPN